MYIDNYYFQLHITSGNPSHIAYWFSVGSQYDTSADEASAQIEYFLQEDPERVLMHLCETASIHAECGLASLVRRQQ